MINLIEYLDNARIWLLTKTEMFNEVTFYRAENAALKAKVAQAQRSEADAIALMAEAELRAERWGCTDLIHMQLASENARLRTALGEPMEAKK